MTDLKKYQDALKKASATIEQLISENERLKRKEPIAIIGMGCRLPGGANSPEEYWRLLSEGRDAVAPIPEDRWPASRYFDQGGETAGKMYVREGGFLDHSPYAFDSRFFGISPREAKALDPQQRLLLETAWEALEDAAIAPCSLRGSRTGVFIGISSSDYERAHLFSDNPSLIDPYSLTGITFSTAAGRISYTLGLEGPCLPVDTACSSSLVSLHLACRSLNSGECDLALAGGVNLMLGPEALIAFCKLRALAPDGRSKAFAASANGYGRGEGCGMIVLKRLEAAERDGDRVLALVKGSALNNDGRSNGFTTPNGVAQRKVIAAALDDAALQAGDIDYVEAHGTGTPLGDPIEIEAIAAALGPGHDVAHPLLVGSAKTNIGHLEAAAGVAGIIKLILALNRERIPRHLHFSVPNPHVAWDQLPLRVVAHGVPWPRSTRPRRAGISGFGFSGTNAHVILEEAPPEKSPIADRRTHHLLVISAADEAALRTLAGRYAEFLEQPGLPPLAAICNTAATGRSRFPSALAVAGAEPQELAQRLSAFASQGTTKGLHLRMAPVPHQPGPVFLFTGQGSQYPGMGLELYETSPVYRQALDRCDSLFAPLLGLSIRNLMHGGSEEELARTINTQPAIFSLEYSLARLWQSWGVVPSAVLGHSIGELVAACVAGVLSLEDAVTLVAHRGRLMNALPAGGVMAAVLCQEAVALPVIASWGDQVSVAAVNAPGTVVISGEQAGVAAALEEFRLQGISSQYLTVSHAFHSHLMEPVLDEFEQIAASLTFHQPVIPVISNVTGSVAVGDDLISADYWRRHLRGAVRFGDSIRYLQAQGYNLFCEVGATATLSSFARQNAGIDCRCAASLKRGIAPWSTLSAALCELFAAGAEIDWKGYDAPYQAGRISIPTYPFQRERYFMDPVHDPEKRTTSNRRPDAVEGDRGAGEQPAAPLLYSTVWRELSPLGAPASLNGRWLALTEDSPYCAAIVAAIRAAGANLKEMRDPDTYTDDDLNRLVNVLQESGPLAGVISLRGDSPLANLNLVRALLEAGISPKLFLVTSAVHNPIGGEGKTNPHGAALWGLGASIAAEVPALGCTLLDLSSQPEAEELTSLICKLAAGEGEDRVALRGARRFVPRLVPDEVPPFAEKDGLPQDQADRFIDPCASYLITGGLGSLGLAVAGHLVDQGCRHLVLIGRNVLSAKAAQTVEALRRGGVQVEVMAGDVAEAADVTRIMAEVRATMPPLKGIFHAAGVLADAMLGDLDASKLDLVMRPKIAGAWNLHHATAQDGLELFVLFSSLTAVTGSPGQAGYAAANAALDGFARWRRANGLTAVSINWGPWGETGLASHAQKGERLTARGIRGIATGAGLETLDAVLRSKRVEQCVADLDLQKLSRFVPATGSGLYAELFSREEHSSGEANEERADLDMLRRACPADRPALMLGLVRELAAMVAGEDDPLRMEIDRPLQEQGFDSLMAVDLRNLITKTFDMELPVSLLFDYPTPQKIAGFLLDEVLTLPEGDDRSKVAATAVSVDNRSADELVAEIEQLLGKGR